ncbi:MAG: hypothetical protein QE267_01725 [Akkermansiaceae bacterium]|nr:hypothetical protein [Akkermansiaceae bacterium]
MIAVFDDMLQRSIPQYNAMRMATFEVGRRFVQPGTAIIDIGCSRSQALLREIVNWGAKAMLATKGMLGNVEATIAALPKPQRTVVSLAWAGDAKLARNGQTVLVPAKMLGLSPARLDAMCFSQCTP